MKLTYKELIYPILYNEISNLIPLIKLDKQNIKTNLKRYIDFHNKAKLNSWTSLYVDIPNYKAYVYLIYDVLYNKYYIGVRYTPNKNNINLLEDLKQYKSSSSDKIFKKRLDDNINNFKLTVLKSFDNELDARNYEALLHTIFSVDTNIAFYNKTSANYIYYALYFTKFYNLKTNEICNYSDIQECISDYDVYNTSKRSTLIFRQHYCLYDTRIESMQEYIRMNKVYILYKYNIKLQKIIEYKIKYKDGYKYIGATFCSLTKGLLRQCNEYYLDKSLCIKYVVNKHTIYWYDSIQDNMNELTCTYNDCIQQGIPINTLLKKGVSSVYGFYLDKQLCLTENKKVVLYQYDNINHTVNPINICNIDGHKVVGKHYSELMNPNVPLYSSNGYYLDRNECINHNRIFEFHNINTNEYINIHIKTGHKIIGRKIMELVKGVQKTHNGWELIREINPIY